MLEDKIHTMIDPILTEMGYGVVRVQIQASKRANLQIMIERLDDLAITVADCSRVSRHLSAVFDAEDFMNNRYNLEVSSPGIDRPLVKFQDFMKFSGLMAKITLKIAHNGGKKFNWRIMQTDLANQTILFADELVRTKTKEVIRTEISVDFDNIDAAKLIFNDEILELAQNGKLPGSVQPDEAVIAQVIAQEEEFMAKIRAENAQKIAESDGEFNLPINQKIEKNKTKPSKNKSKDHKIKKGLYP